MPGGGGGAQITGGGGLGTTALAVRSCAACLCCMVAHGPVPGHTQAGGCVRAPLPVLFSSIHASVHLSFESNAGILNHTLDGSTCVARSVPTLAFLADESPLTGVSCAAAFHSLTDSLHSSSPPAEKDGSQEGNREGGKVIRIIHAGNQSRSQCCEAVHGGSRVSLAGVRPGSPPGVNVPATSQGVRM